jgi:pyrroline-5-carboxylate reductase
MAQSRKSKAKAGILLIGAGRMGGALLKGWLKAGRFSPIHVVEPLPSAELKRLARAKKIVLSNHFDGAKLPRLAAVVIALKPQVLKNQAELLASLGRTQALVLSIAAGTTTGFLRRGLGTSSPVVRAMPNTPGAIGRGITVLYAARLAAPQKALAEALMAALGETLWVPDEAMIDAVTAVSGSGPAYVFLLAEALASAGRAEGLDPGAADRLARATVAGAGALLDADTRAPAILRQEVTSPGGTTEAALKLLMGEDGLERLMRQAVAAAARRGRELGS